MPLKLSDGEVAALREAWDAGVSAPDLAAEFGVTEQHVRRLVRGDQRQLVSGADVVASRSSVVSAVDGFLAKLQLDAGDLALASVAQALASKLDACAVAETGAAAGAVPRLATELVEVLERLRASEPREPDGLDRLRMKRTARLAGQRTEFGTRGN
jgi:predicted transcriptional regulator